MNKQIEKVFSEQPENDLWQELLQFTYEENIKKYLENNNHTVDKKLTNCVVGSFLQAYEYYKAANSANLQIAPLLLYYGSTNLLYGMTNLISGTIIEIKNHGMKIVIPDELNSIADVKVKFFNAKSGGVHVFGRELGFQENLTQFGEWETREFLESIAEINEDYKKCYDVPCGKIVMLDEFNTPDGKVEKVYYNEDNRDNINDILNSVENFKKSYLNITKGKSSEDGQKYFILRHKINGQDIYELSYSGQPYLQAAQKKNGHMVTVPTVINMYIVLFVLSSLCRYHPEQWSPFVLNDNTGEKLLIEKFLYYARRIIPNLVLNVLLGKDVQYVSNMYQATDTTKFVGEHQIQDIVRREVNKAIDEEKFAQENMRIK